MTGEVKGAEWLARAAQAKASVLARLDSMPEAMRTSAPAPGVRSASHVVEHLILFEEQIIGPWRQGLFEKRPLRARLKPGPLRDVIGFISVLANYPMPGAPVPEPKGGIGIEELRSRWDTAREKLVAALPEGAQDPWILHPWLGLLNSDQIWKLVATHGERCLRRWPDFKA